MRGLVLAAVAALGMAGAADAAIYRFDYVGPRIFLYEAHVVPGCYDGEVACDPWALTRVTTDPIPGWFIVDESLLPGGTLAGVSFSTYGEYDIQEFSITTADGETTSGVQKSPSSTLDWSMIGITAFDYAMLESPIEYYAYFTATFDLAGKLSAWSGNSTYGGTGDPYSAGPDGPDAYDGLADYGRSLEAGYWKRTTLSPVPLPASAVLMLTGAGWLFAFRRRASSSGTAT